VRSHLKQIFTKCEVKSQAELMHLLAQGPSSL
jgi:DNA-binding CsgD family transcriptional regulator